MKIIILVLLLTFSIYAQTGGTIWQPSDKCKICDQLILEGQTYRIIEDEKYYVAINPFYDKGYIVTFVYLENKTDEKFDFKPYSHAQLLTWKSSKDYPYNSEIVTIIEPEKIVKKLENRAKWSNFLTVFAANMQTRSVNVVTTTPGLPPFTSTVTMPDQAARDQAERNVKQTNERLTSQSDKIMSYALKANTVFPTSRLYGHIFYPNKKSEVLAFNIAIKDRIYTFVYFLNSVPTPKTISTPTQATNNISSNSVEHKTTSTQENKANNLAQDGKSFNEGGYYKFQRKEFSDAESSYRTAISVEPYNPIYHSNLAAALNAQGKFDEAEKEMDLASRLAPNSTAFKEYLELIRSNKHTGTSYKIEPKP